MAACDPNVLHIVRGTMRYKTKLTCCSEIALSTRHMTWSSCHFWHSVVKTHIAGQVYAQVTSMGGLHVTAAYLKTW